MYLVPTCRALNRCSQLNMVAFCWSIFRSMTCRQESMCATCMVCSLKKCYEDSLHAYYVKLKFKRRALNPRVHSHGRGPHAEDIDMHVMPTIHGSSQTGPLPARVVAASYSKAQLHRASMPEWLRDLSNGFRVLMCTLQFPQHSPFDRT